MLHRWCILLALAALALFAGCGGGSVSQDINSQSNGGDRQSSDVTNQFDTMLIAGAGQGWPATGTDVGELSVWQDGNTLVVQYCLDDGYEFDQDVNQNLHLYISEDWPPLGPNGNPTVAPGQFPYSAFVANPDDCYQFEFNMNQMGWGGGDTLYIAAHGNVCEAGDDSGGGDGGGDGYYTYEVCAGAYDPPETATIWAGQTIDAGTATFSISDDGQFLIVDISLNDSWEICQDHLWVGTTPDGYPQTGQGNPIPGQFPYSHDFGDPPNPQTDQFQVPLSDIDGFFWDGDEGHICVVLHLTICRGDDGEGGYTETQTGFAWYPGEDDFPGPRWGGGYCFDVCRTWNYYDPPPGGGGGGGNCQTMWGFDMSSAGEDDGVSENEVGWFPNLGFTRWGWRIIYGVE